MGTWLTAMLAQRGQLTVVQSQTSYKKRSTRALVCVTR